MAYNPVVWFEIYVADMQRAAKFYEAVLQTRLKELQSPSGIDIDMMAFPGGPENGGATGALVRMEGVPQGMAGTLVYFTCKDCGVEAARAEQSGGRIERPKMSIGPYGFIAHCRDSEGNLFGLHSME